MKKCIIKKANSYHSKTQKYRDEKLTFPILTTYKKRLTQESFAFKKATPTEVGEGRGYAISPQK